MEKMYELSSEEVVQLCTALEFYILKCERAKEGLRRSDRVVTDEEVLLYKQCTKEIEAAKKMYNKFRS